MIQVKGKGKLLRQYQLGDLSAILSSFAQLVGVTPANLPDRNAMALLLDSVVHLYGHLTDEEVKNAFTMLIAGKIDLGKDGQHYQNFSAKYFSDVVQAYLKYAVRIIQQIPEVVEEKIIPPPVMTEEEFIEEAYQSWFTMKNKLPQFVNPYTYGKLVKAGLLTLSEEQRASIKQRACRQVEEIKEAKDFKTMAEHLAMLKEDKTYNDHIQEQCKKIAVADFFNSQMAEGKLKIF